MIHQYSHKISFLFPLTLLVLSFIFIFGHNHPSKAAALPSLNCSADYQINQGSIKVPLFKNGTGWSFCWSPQRGYGYSVTQVRYSYPQSKTIQILASMNVAQMFVPYDNNVARYHDISYGTNLAKLKLEDCPLGTISASGTLCITLESRDLSVRTNTNSLPTTGERLRIFGYYGIGAYYYTFQYIFNDDGSIEPSMGASGSLQWTSADPKTGWPVTKTSNSNPYGTNHNHLIMWRLNFSIDDGTAGTSVPPMTVEQLDYQINNQKSELKPLTPTQLNKETSKLNSLATERYWRVSNTSLIASFALEQSVATQYRATTESFTLNDFYLSQYKKSEILVDGGLAGKYVTNESVTNPVVWYGVNFHHVPREEDDVRMPQHWQGFTIRPISLP